MTSKHSFYIFPLVFLSASLFLTGCSKGPNTAQVTGVVTLDGEAVAGVQVRFSPVSRERSSMGFTDANGRYTLRFTESQIGCIPGDHVVRFEAFRDPEDETTQYLPAQYNARAQDNEEMSKTVKAGKQIIDFNLTSK